MTPQVAIETIKNTQIHFGRFQNKSRLILALIQACDALEKQIPKKRINILKMDELLGCSNCKQYLLPYCRYCPNCGQVVDWSNTE